MLTQRWYHMVRSSVGIGSPGAWRGWKGVIVNRGLRPDRLADMGCEIVALNYTTMFASSRSSTPEPESLYLRDKAGKPYPIAQWPGAVFVDFTKPDGPGILAEWTDRTADQRFAIYADMTTADFPPYLHNQLPPAIAAVQTEAWPGFRDTFLEDLRNRRPERIVIGNTAGLTSPHLNGIAIEQSHQDQKGRLWALGRWSVQLPRGEQPCHNIDWSDRLDLPPIVQRGYIRPG